MASIRQAAQDVLDVASDGIGWIAFYRSGRGWGSCDVWPDYDDRTKRLALDDYDRKLLQEIVAEDPQAILVNSYIHNLGVSEGEATIAGLADGLRWQYKMQHSLAVDAI